MASVLFVDDEAALRRAVQRWLGRSGVTVHTARGVAGAKRCFAHHRIDGAFVDVWLGDGTGYELYDWIRAHHPAVAERVVFLTGDIVPSPISDERLQATGRPLLTKPFELSTLDRWVAQWTRHEAPRAPDTNDSTGASARGAQRGVPPPERDA